MNKISRAHKLIERMGKKNERFHRICSWKDSKESRNIETVLNEYRNIHRIIIERKSHSCDGKSYGCICVENRNKSVGNPSV